MNARRLTQVMLAAVVGFMPACAAVWAEEPYNQRRPADDEDLRYWLENMVWHHRFSGEEIAAATGLSADEIEGALARFDIRTGSAPRRPEDAPLLVLPYPGGRHPRIGFLDGAVAPQRETKISVFAHVLPVTAPALVLRVGTTCVAPRLDEPSRGRHLPPAGMLFTCGAARHAAPAA